MRLDGVIEVMRARPTQTLENAPLGVAGVGMIRGVPCPIVDLGTLLDGSPGQIRPGSRWISVQLGTRVAALAVDEVMGIRTLDDRSLSDCSPLLRSAAGARIESLGRLDAELLLVLRGGLVLPDDAWPHAEASA